MRCTFCATGSGGFARNLTASEIVDQVLTVQEHFATRVSNVGARPSPLVPPFLCGMHLGGLRMGR